MFGSKKINKYLWGKQNKKELNTKENDLHILSKYIIKCSKVQVFLLNKRQ